MYGNGVNQAQRFGVNTIPPNANPVFVIKSGLIDFTTLGVPVIFYTPPKNAYIFNAGIEFETLTPGPLASLNVTIQNTSGNNGQTVAPPAFCVSGSIFWKNPIGVTQITTIGNASDVPIQYQVTAAATGVTTCTGYALVMVCIQP